MSNPSKRICVYCASSQRCDQLYHKNAYRTGEILAGAGYEIVYGGGAVGSMGALADGALAHGGRVIGIMPQFMKDLEWDHPRISELQLVEDMRERKHQMLTGSSGLIALPGGSGTLEELLEAITLKRLGIYLNPILVVNTNRMFDSLINLFDRIITEKFMDERHSEMWTIISSPDEILDALKTAPDWSPDSREFAAVK